MGTDTTYSQTDRQTHRQTDSQTDSQTDRQADRQTALKTNFLMPYFSFQLIMQCRYQTLSDYYLIFNRRVTFTMTTRSILTTLKPRRLLEISKKQKRLVKYRELFA